MARGTKPTVAQSNILRSNGLNPKEWLFLKEEYSSDDGGSRLSRNTGKDRVMVIKHRTDGSTRRIAL